jgi:hypothetical protein
MTTVQEVQKRNNKAQNLRVIQVEKGDHFVSSEDGLILYKVICGNGDKNSCTCGDFAKGIKTDPNHVCKHILAVMNCEHDTEKAKYLEKAQPKLDPRFIVRIEDQDFVKYQGLLDVSHGLRLCSMDVEILQTPTKDNGMMAICKAKAQTATGDTFSDVGDANPTNCHYKVVKHLLRIASTRAKARALRDMTNIGMTCLEELGDLEEVIEGEEKGTVQKGKVKPFPKKILKAESPASQPNNGNGKGTLSAADSKETKEPQKDEKKTVAQPDAKVSEKSGNNGKGKTKADIPPKMSEAQHRAIMNLSRRRGISVEELEKISTDTFGVPLDKLSASDAVSLIRNLQQSA